MKISQSTVCLLLFENGLRSNLRASNLKFPGGSCTYSYMLMQAYIPVRHTCNPHSESSGHSLLLPHPHILSRCNMLTSGSRFHTKHSWFQHRVVSQYIQHSFLTASTVRVNQKPIKPCFIYTTVCCNAVDHCESGVITAQSYPTTRSQLVAIVVPGQGSEEVMDADIVTSVCRVVLDVHICDPHLQCYHLRWSCMLHSACANNIQQT